MLCVNLLETKHRTLLLSEMSSLLENYTVKEVKGVEPIISYSGNIFLSVEELHQWKIEHMWNGIDIAVSVKDILR